MHIRMRRAHLYSRCWRRPGQGGRIDSRRSATLRQEPVKKRVQVVAQLLDNIAAFLDQQNRHIDAADPLADRTKSLGGDCKIRSRIADMRVEAERNDQRRCPESL